MKYYIVQSFRSSRWRVVRGDYETVVAEVGSEETARAVLRLLSL